MLPKDKIKYIGIIAFLVLGALICLFGGIHMLFHLPFGVVVLIAALFCFCGAGGMGWLSWKMIREYRWWLGKD